MLLGYMRVSTDDQTMALQQDALQGAGCDRLYTDVASGAKADRPGLTKLLDQARTGDTVVIWRLDRLGRNLKHLIATVGDLSARGVGLRSLTEQIDTSTPGGMLIFHVFGALAEFEREVIRERTLAGLASARARGRTGGRPCVSALTEPARLTMARRLYDDRSHSVAEICDLLGISRSTFYRRVARTSDRATLAGGSAAM